MRYQICRSVVARLLWAYASGMADKRSSGGLVVVVVLIALMVACNEAFTKDERACEEWAESLSDAVRTAIHDAETGLTSHAGRVAREESLEKQAAECSSWQVGATVTAVCEAWYDDVYVVARDWPLTVTPQDEKAATAAIKKELREALALRPYAECASDDWKIQSARDNARVNVDVSIPAPNGSVPNSDTESTEDEAGMVDPTYTGCRAYGDDGRWVDDVGRRYDKIDCTTKVVIG